MLYTISIKVAPAERGLGTPTKLEGRRASTL